MQEVPLTVRSGVEISKKKWVPNTLEDPETDWTMPLLSRSPIFPTSAGAQSVGENLPEWRAATWTSAGLTFFFPPSSLSFFCFFFSMDGMAWFGHWKVFFFCFHALHCRWNKRGRFCISHALHWLGKGSRIGPSASIRRAETWMSV